MNRNKKQEHTLNNRENRFLKTSIGSSEEWGEHERKIIFKFVISDMEQIRK